MFKRIVQKIKTKKKWRNRITFEKSRRKEKKSRLRAWLEGQIGWGARLAGRPDWIIPYPSLSQ
jgi:hypothetical protein